MSTSTMKAAVYESFGSPDNIKIQEIPRPVIGENDVLIRVVATSINPIDWKILGGYVQKLPGLAQPEPSAEKPNQLGFDVAGTIEALGSKVTQFQVGDEVYSDCPTTTAYAEFVAVPASAVAKKPTNVSFEQAAGIPLVGLTSYQALHQHGQMKKGDNVLILGGSTATGIFAIQFAKAAGAHVTTTGSPSKEPFLKALGAETFIDYRTQHYEEVLKDEPKFDVIYDIGGASDSISKSLSILKPEGRYVTIIGERLAELGAYKQNPDLDEHKRFKEFILTQRSSDDLRAIASLVEEGKVITVEEKVFTSFEQIQDALKHSMKGGAKGKIIVHVSSP